MGIQIVVLMFAGGGVVDLGFKDLILFYFRDFILFYFRNLI